jgi:AcrR family transcriptional regulator
MPRWEPDAPQRLAQAAIELFAERGYAETSVIDIAHRAGLAKSTFFRHFASKREVLFGEDSLSQVLTGTIASAPAGTRPFDVIAHVIQALDEQVFPLDYRDIAARRRAVIEAHPDLREREALKSAHLVEDAARAFELHCDSRTGARLAAQLCLFVITEAYEQWAVDDRGSARRESFAAAGARVAGDAREALIAGDCQNNGESGPA